MPRKGRGGRRQGVQGRNYPNRRDLQRSAQPVRAAPSDVYGQRVAAERAQQAVPLPQQPGPPPPGAVPAAPIPPDAVPTLGAPSSRPDEPITAGLPFGPGRNPGPGERRANAANEDIIDRVRALYLQYPTQELAELLDEGWL